MQTKHGCPKRRCRPCVTAFGNPKASGVCCTAMDTQYIDTEAGLLELCQRLSAAPWFALDTEFMRESTYYPKLCLLQLATPEFRVCVDPLALDNLSPLLDLIYDPSITKVMHAGGQDLEILYHLRGALPRPLFDTQLAAPLLGYPEQAGYARLVEDILNVRLAKTHTRADWAHRPLTPAQLKYAADDVIYLCRLYAHLRDALQKRQRLSWLDEEFNALSDPARYENPPALAWRRVKAAYKLRGPTLAVLQAIAQWREETAQQQDRPRAWLLKDDALVDIARQQPKDLAELGRIRGLHPSTLKRHGKTLLDLLRDARQREPEPLPAHVRAAKPSTKQEALVDLLNAVVHLRAEEHQLNPAQLAARKELQGLVLGRSDLNLLTGWRRKLIGEELLAVLAGERSLQIIDGELVIRQSAP